jgi:hypothetical protein
MNYPLLVPLISLAQAVFFLYVVMIETITGVYLCCLPRG